MRAIKRALNGNAQISMMKMFARVEIAIGKRIFIYVTHPALNWLVIGITTKVCVKRLVDVFLMKDRVSAIRQAHQYRAIDYTMKSGARLQMGVNSINMCMRA